MKLVILGPPGAGKGTRALRLMELLSIPQISTGNMLRAAMREGTALGREARCYIDAGLLVPDEVVVEMVRERIAQPDCEGGFILDGFPRTLAQAEALDEIIQVDAVLNLELPDEVIMERLSGRRICPVCGGVFRRSTLADPLTCPVCGAELVIREDDRPETIRNRLRVYRAQTEPLISYYRGKGLLTTVSALGELEDNFQGVLEALGIKQK